jgi:hypothetical protein
MKYIFSIIIIYVLISLDWTGIFKRKDKIRDFIPGIYVFYNENMRTKFWDTLQIKEQRGNKYIIQKKSFVHFLDPDYHIADKRDSALYIVFYDAAKKQLLDFDALPLIGFDPDKGCLYYRSFKFRKIEQ